MNPILRLMTLAASLLLLAAAGAGETRAAEATTKPAEVTWQKHADEAEVVKVKLPGSSGEVEALKVTLPATGGTVRILELKDPKIAQASYGIEGKVRYENVKGNGFIEMWSHFPDGSMYFTRTLDASGPMGVLHGKSNWREFKLPFHSEAGKAPSKLEVNIVLPEGGTVWIGPATLKDGLPAAPPAAKKAGAALPWWGPRQGGWMGAVLGCVLGSYGALIGLLASRPRTRRTVLPLMTALTVACALCLVLGVIALGIGQPYAVWYPLTMSGVIGVAVSGGLLPMIKRRLAEDELRRMTALDA